MDWFGQPCAMDTAAGRTAGARDAEIDAIKNGWSAYSSPHGAERAPDEFVGLVPARTQSGRRAAAAACIGGDEISAFTAPGAPRCDERIRGHIEVTHVLFVRPDVAAVKVRQRPVTLDGEPIDGQNEGRPLLIMRQGGRAVVPGCGRSTVVLDSCGQHGPRSHPKSACRSERVGSREPSEHHALSRLGPPLAAKPVPGVRSAITAKRRCRRPIHPRKSCLPYSTVPSSSRTAGRHAEDGCEEFELDVVGSRKTSTEAKGSSAIGDWVSGCRRCRRVPRRWPRDALASAPGRGGMTRRSRHGPGRSQFR